MSAVLSPRYLKHIGIDAYLPTTEAVVQLPTANTNIEHSGDFNLAGGSQLQPAQNLVLVANQRQAPAESVIALLQNILLYLNMSPQLCCIAMKGGVGKAVSEDGLLKVVKPQLILNFGVELDETLNDAVTYIHSQDLSEALHNPMLKEQILRDVYQLSL